MKLVAWNCAGGFQAKRAALDRLAPDLAVVCEVHARTLADIADTEALWTGDSPDAKGLALLGFGGWKLTQRYVGPLPNVIAAHARRGNEEVLLVGVWTVPSNRSYTLPLAAMCADEAFHALLEEWRGWPVIVAGDFNASDVFSKSRPLFSEVRGALEALGLRSLWHARSGDGFGAETQATFYFHWHETKPFHIDYMFVSGPCLEACRSFEIGTFGEWTLPKVSDHVPLIAEFSLTPDSVASVSVSN
ncbi:MAG: endonuclease/exonuclease/phosphatase family protein [Hyphomonas sp.]